MMSRNAAQHLLIALGVSSVALLSTALIAGATSTPVMTRVAGYKDLGAAFKGINDGVRRGSFGEIPALAKRISVAAKAQYRWYPAGSGPGKGVKTTAKSEIWSKPSAFKAAQDRFAAQARVFQIVSTSKDGAAIRSAARELGATCKACHDSFRVAAD